MNISRAFPDLPAGAREVLLKESAAALGANLYDALALARHAPRNLAAVTDDGAGAAARALLKEGRGLLVLTGHLGCWELLGAWLARELGGLAVVTGTVHNAPVDRLLNEQRIQLGLQPLPRGGDLRPMLRHLRAGGAVAVLLDQNTHVHNLDVPFFGRPAPTPVGFARLALRLKAPILPVAIRRRGEGHHVRHLPALRPVGAEKSQTVYDLLSACNAALERLIREAPAEWIWFHERW